MPRAGLNRRAATFVLRKASSADLAAVSGLVALTLRISNTADYSPETIDRILIDFTPEALAESFPRRTVWVASRGTAIVGTASLEGSRVHAFFVSPEMQGQGCGAALFAALEAQAGREGAAGLCVRSSLTARGFYERQGFVAIRAETINGIATVWLEKPIGSTLKSSSPSSARSPA
jgi:GNAT superfamily N-acetyltransferase